MEIITNNRKLVKEIYSLDNRIWTIDVGYYPMSSIYNPKSKECLNISKELYNMEVNDELLDIVGKQLTNLIKYLKSNV